MNDAPIHTITKYRSPKWCDEYMGIFSKHATNIGETDLVQMTHTQNNIEPP